MKALFVLFFLLQFLSPAYGELTDNLQLHYEFSNGLAMDSSVNQITPTVHGTQAISDRKGDYTSALLFDGIDDYLDVGTQSALNFHNETQASFAFWFKTSYTESTLFEQFGNDNMTIYKFQIHFGYPRFEYRKSLPASSLITGIKPVNDGEWHHVAIVLNGSKIQMYLDAELNSEENQTGNIYGTGPLAIGKEVMGAGWFCGVLDDFRIYNRALNQSEIKTLVPKGAYAVFPVPESEDSEPPVICIEQTPMPLIWNNFDAENPMDDNRYLVIVSEHRGYTSPLIEEIVINDNILIIPPEILLSNVNAGEQKLFFWQAMMLSDSSKSLTNTTMAKGRFEIKKCPVSTRSKRSVWDKLPGFVYGRTRCPIIYVKGENKKFLRSFYRWYATQLIPSSYDLICIRKNKHINIQSFKIYRVDM